MAAGATLDITSDVYKGRCISNASTPDLRTCLLHIEGFKKSGSYLPIVFGDAILKHFLTIYDLERKEVLFGASKPDFRPSPHHNLALYQTQPLLARAADSNNLRIVLVALFGLILYALLAYAISKEFQ